VGQARRGATEHLEIAARRFILTPYLMSAVRPFPFSLSGVIAAGEYALDFRIYGDVAAYPKAIFFDGVKVTDGRLRIAPGSQSTLRVVMALDVASLAVAVNDADGNRVPGATVAVFPDWVTTAAALSQFATRGVADQNGDFNAARLPPGKYRLLSGVHDLLGDGVFSHNGILYFHAKSPSR
jgi:hypothetical protein